jgi:hypothetical protein
MPKNKNKTNYTPEQLDQLSGNYKNSDNTRSIEKNETNHVDGDGVSTKRPQ